MAKVESLNPGGSIKDRVAVALIEAAERDGKLKPGGTIVEPTSGNTGTGLAIAARLKGYRVIAVMPDKMSKEKIDLLRAYGAEVVVAPTAVPPESPESYYRVAERLAAGDPGRLPAQPVPQPRQPAGALPLHRRPSCGSRAAGASRTWWPASAPAARSPAPGATSRSATPSLQVIGADPYGSIYSSPEVKPYLVEGVGEDFWPETYDPSIVDRYVTVSDRDAFLTTRRLAMVEGILAGGSGGLAVHAALEVAREISDPEAHGRGHPPRRRALVPVEGLQRRVDDPARLPRARRPTRRWATCSTPSRRRARSRRSSPSGPTRRSATPSRSCTSTASPSCRSSARTTPRRSSARSASAACSSTPWTTRRCSTPISSTSWKPPFPAVSSGDPVREAVELLVGDRQALMVTEQGRATGILTRADLLEALAR